ncbi:MAG: EAL domain-containing protein [Pseudomonadota bacterium]|nr:EAL domain-containing protein [Pseudomonadota bacterium]
MQTILAIAGLALAYYLAAKLSQPLTAPPSGASAFWPAAGISLAFVLKFGPKLLPGVFIGSLMTNIELYGLNMLSSPSASILLFVIIALSSTLSAYFGLKLIQKYARYPDPLTSELSTLKLLVLGGPIAAILPMMISISALIFTGIISTEHALFSCFTWWLGDSVGVFIITPLILLFVDLPGKTDANRKWAVTIPVIFALLITIGLFQNSVDSENKRLQMDLDYKASTIGAELNREINTHINLTQYLRDTIVTNGYVELDNFIASTHSIRQLHPDIQAITWDVLVKNEQRSLFEKQMQSIHHLDYQITKRDGQDNMIRIEGKPEYAAIAYISPYKNNEKSLGYDLTSNPELAAFFYNARDTGKATITSRVNLAQSGNARIGIINYLPVYKNGHLLDTIIQRQIAFIGNLTSIFYLDDIIADELKAHPLLDSDLTILDITENDHPIKLYSTITNAIIDNNLTTFYSTHIANRIWQIKITPSADYFKNNYSNNMWIVLFIGMLFTATLTVALMISTGRRACIEEVVTQRTASLQKAKEDLRLLAITFESNEAIMITDSDNLIIRVNQAFTKVTGYTQEDVLGKNPDILSSGKHSVSFYENMWQQLKENGSYESEIWNRRKNGEVYPERHTITSISDESGKITNYVSVFSDITSQKAHKDRIQFLAFYDQLTSLPNRRLLLDRLQYNLSLSQRNKKHGVLMFLDLDDFKKINDSLGHEVGDELLQRAAARIKLPLRRADTLARLGGDEFVILVANQTLEGEALIEFASNLAEKIIIAFQQPFHIKGYEHHISSSIGITIFPTTEQTAVSILGQADTAMYKSKKMGKNTFCFYEQAMQAIAEAKLALEHDLRRAIEQQQFSLNYQPQVDNSGKVLAIEALLRWQHPERSWVSPAEFIPLAEDSGLIIPIGQWVLINACTQLQSWLKQGLQIQHISVNVSPKQFRQNDFIANIKSALNQSGLPAKNLMLEITEGIVLDNVEDTIQKMDTLKQIGIQFSIDDFGTGYSSLSYLKRLPIDELKIDQSFVRDIATDKDDAAIVATIIAMASHLNLTVVAEGVENFQQLDFLTANGCVLFQGYHFSRPLTAVDLLSFVQKNKL